MMILIKVKNSTGTKYKAKPNSVDKDLVRVHWEVQYLVSENSTSMVQRFLDFLEEA